MRKVQACARAALAVLCSVAVATPAAAGSTEDWLRWRVEQDPWLQPLDAADAWWWIEERPRVIRVGVAPAPPRIALRAGLAGGDEPQVAVGVTLSMGTRPVYRAVRGAGRRDPGEDAPPEGDGLAAPADGRGSAGGALEALLRGEPAIADVQRAAIRHAGCGETVVRALQRDARAFGALPEIAIQGQLDGGWDRDLDPFGNATGMGDEQAWDLQLEVEWDLADLAMSYERIRVEDARQDLVRQRAEVVEEVTAAYYDRQRLRARLRPGAEDLDAEQRLTLELQLRQVTALLDGMTGGAFSALLDERGREYGEREE